MLDDDTATTTGEVQPEQPPTPPRRHRSASRPAGPPAAVTAPVPAEVAPAAAAVEVAPTAVEVAAVAPEDPSPAPIIAGLSREAEAPVKAKRTRAPRKPKAESAVEPSPADTLPEVDARPEVAPEVALEAQSQLPAEEPAPTRRRRGRTAEATTGESAAPTRRRGRAAAASEPAPEPAPAAEEIVASLDVLEARAPRRRPRVKAETFGIEPGADPASVLDSLAAAIGGSAVGAEELLEEELAEDAELAAQAAAEAAAEADDEADADEEADADDTAEAEADDDDAEDSDEGAGGVRRRRRRRGGRRRRRSGTADDAGEPGAEDSEEGAVAEEAGAPETETEPGGEPAAEGGSRRRRRRRRRGEDVGEAEDDPGTEVVVRVREPRRTRSVSDEVTGIEGSTRMEAKKQRRREGRAAGRRRSPILSESEFLARREAVDRAMLIRQAEDFSQIAVLEDGVLVEHYVDRASATSMIGNIYLGRVQNVLPSMEAAFVDIGRGRNAVLYAGEVDWESFGVTGQEKKVERVFKSGQSVLVQVSKDPVGAKGARLTSHISLPGRYIVYSPGGQLSGISRKLPENERKRLKSILDELIGPDASVIVRTAAEGASEEELVRDVNRLKAQWEVIEKKVKGGQAPQLLYAEPDLTVRIIRDLFTEDFSRLVVDGNGEADDAYDSVDAYVSHVAPHLETRLVKWDRAAQGDIFDAHRVHEQVAKALERKVFLPSGGSLIIDRTEAMTVIDVNTGRFTGTSGNLEATVTSNNLEAAEEIVRQLRLRDVGGIIVIDFIDMVLPSNRELLLRRLVECLGRDRTRHQVAEVTSLGLVQMTRKKIGTGLAEAFTVPCETCSGRGYHVHDVPVATQAPADGGDRDGRRQGRGGGNSQPRRQPPQSQPAARVRRTSPGPELAAVVAATFAHSHAGERAPEPQDASPESPLDGAAAEVAETAAAPDVAVEELVEPAVSVAEAEVAAESVEGEEVVAPTEVVDVPEPAEVVPEAVVETAPELVEVEPEAVVETAPELVEVVPEAVVETASESVEIAPESVEAAPEPVALASVPEPESETAPSEG